MNRMSRVIAIVVAAALSTAASLAASPRPENTVNPAWGYGPGYGMMGRGGYAGMRGPGMMGYGAGGQVQPLEKPLTLDAAEERVTKALKDWGYTDLEVEEIVQYSLNFYALVAEKATGKGALELLIDPRYGTVSLEPGPGMMWNTRYGRMHWSGQSAAAAVSADDAKRIAREWLATRGDITTWEYEVTEMPGYYSVHLERDGRMEAMLGVNAATGAVWYHTWHGTFVAAKETEH